MHRRAQNVNSSFRVNKVTKGIPESQLNEVSPAIASPLYCPALRHNGLWSSIRLYESQRDLARVLTLRVTRNATERIKCLSGSVKYLSMVGHNGSKECPIWDRTGTIFDKKSSSCVCVLIQWLAPWGFFFWRMNFFVEETLELMSKEKEKQAGDKKEKRRDANLEIIFFRRHESTIASFSIFPLNISEYRLLRYNMHFRRWQRQRHLLLPIG